MLVCECTNPFQKQTIPGNAPKTSYTILRASSLQNNQNMNVLYCSCKILLGIYPAEAVWQVMCLVFGVYSVAEEE